MRASTDNHPSRTLPPMPTRIDAAHARSAIESQLAGIARLRGTGPNPFEYNQ